MNSHPGHQQEGSIFWAQSYKTIRYLLRYLILSILMEIGTKIRALMFYKIGLYASMKAWKHESPDPLICLTSIKSWSKLVSFNTFNNLLIKSWSKLVSFNTFNNLFIWRCVYLLSQIPEYSFLFRSSWKVTKI